MESFGMSGFESTRRGRGCSIVQRIKDVTPGQLIRAGQDGAAAALRGVNDGMQKAPRSPATTGIQVQKVRLDLNFFLPVSRLRHKVFSLWMFATFVKTGPRAR